MFNDLSSPLALLLTRRSGKARDMVAPGPDADQIATMITAASRVPDHGKLSPWRFVIVGDDQRAAFADCLLAAYLRERPAASRLEREAIIAYAQHAPCLIVLISTSVGESKIPLWEQQLSAGAAAMQLLNAGHALGFVGNWLTGWPCGNADVAAALGGTGPQDRIVGFFYFGTAAKALEERPRPLAEEIVTSWRP